MAAKSIPQLRQLMTMDIDSLSCLSGVREVAPELGNIRKSEVDIHYDLADVIVELVVPRDSDTYELDLVNLLSSIQTDSHCLRLQMVKVLLFWKIQFLMGTEIVGT